MPGDKLKSDKVENNKCTYLTYTDPEKPDEVSFNVQATQEVQRDALCGFNRDGKRYCPYAKQNERFKAVWDIYVSAIVMANDFKACSIDSTGLESLHPCDFML